MANVLKEHAVDAVVITLQSGTDTEYVITVVQVAIARAAKAAGVNLLVPSEFSMNTEGYAPGNFIGAKNTAFGPSRFPYMLELILKHIDSQNPGDWHCHHSSGDWLVH